MGLPGGGSSGGAPRAASGRSGGAPAAGATSYSGATTPAFDWDKLLAEFLADGVPQTEAEEMIAALKAGNRAKALNQLKAKGLSPDKVAKLTKAIEKAPAMGAAHAERDNWFISQYGSKSNPNEDVPGLDNGNCGPTSLTMIAKAFGKITPDAAGADAAIEESRRRIGDGLNERNGTSVAGLAKGAQSYGLDAKVRWDANLDTIQSELAQGRLVIAHLSTYHLSGNRGGGHYTVVTGIADGKVYLNDPANKNGPMVVDAAKFMESVRDRGTYGMVSIGP
ncbi:Peptidase C39 family protein [compost metagenome]